MNLTPLKQQLKKYVATLSLGIAASLAVATPAHAGAGTMGFFGGISEGLRMPTINARQLNDALNGRRNVSGTFAYSERVFIEGAPVTLTGTLTVTQTGAVNADNDNGTFNVTHVVEAEADEGISLARTVTYIVQWRRENNQVIKNYNVSAWTEVFETPTSVHELDADASFMIVSIIEDHNPGIMFYRGNISKRAVFNQEGAVDGEAFAIQTVVESTGHIYGFDSPYSSTETQSLDVWVLAPDWQMSYQIRPSVSVTTSLTYQQTAPTAISFAGNYLHFMSNQSMAAYDIFIVPHHVHFIETSGSFSIDTHTTFEQLPSPDLTFLRGHFAEQDISRLFAQQILSGPTAHFQPSQAMTRGEYIGALVRALRIQAPVPIQPNVFNRTTRVVFPDVAITRPDYRYIMAAYNSGLAYGRNDGNFHVDTPITREEAVATLIRGLGLANVVPNPSPITVLADSLQVSSWATRDIAAALELGLISGDANGNFRPRDFITKAEAAALINRFIDYMREDLVHDYSARMVNFTW